MKNNLLFLTWLWNRRKASRKTIQFSIPEGGVAIILKDQEQYLKLIDALEETDLWTNGDFSKILTNHTTQIIKN